MRWLSYLWRAFNARPFGMLVPPLWFAALASGLVGYFIAPPLALIGLGGTALFTSLVASSRRFQNTVDAPRLPPPVDEQTQLLGRLDADSRARQSKLEAQCAELQKVLEAAKAGQQHIAGVWQLAGLHLKLLVARSAALAVTNNRDGDSKKSLAGQSDAVKKRLAEDGLDDELKSALEDQRKILEQRLAMQSEASRRLQVLDAELERIREQIALIREQALLASDPASIGRSVDALATFLNESGRWLKDQEDIFGDIGGFAPDPFETGTAGFSAPRQSNGKRVGESQ